MLECWG